MPADIFLKLAGIDGESVDAKHKGEIDVLAWSWGLSEEPPQTGGGGGVGKVKGKDLSIQKLVDLASPLLLLASAEGKHISDGTLTARNESKGGVAQEFLLFKMRNVLAPIIRESRRLRCERMTSTGLTVVDALGHWRRVGGRS